MSRSQRPRTPEHFPRMKHRAKGRAARKQQRQTVAAVMSFSEVITAVGKGFERVIDGFFKLFGDTSQATRDDYVLAE